jgi:hypothetical protein
VVVPLLLPPPLLPPAVPGGNPPTEGTVEVAPPPGFECPSWVGGVVLPGRCGLVVGVLGFVLPGVVVVGVVVVGGAVTVNICGVYTGGSKGSPALSHTAATRFPEPLLEFEGTLNEPCQEPFVATGIRIEIWNVGASSAT